MDSNIDFLRKYANNHILRALSLDTLTFAEISSSILEKTENTYYFKEQALSYCLKELLDKNLVTSSNGCVTCDGHFKITDKGLSYIKNYVKSWDISKEMFERVLGNNYKLYNPDEAENAMYGKNGIAQIKENDVIGIEFYFNNVFQYKPADSYEQLSIESEKDTRKAEALELLGISKKTKNNNAIENSENAEELQLDNERNEETLNTEVAADNTNINRKYTLEEYIRMNEVKTNESPYRATLDAMFANRDNNVVSESLAVKSTSLEMTIATSSYADLKERMLRVGYKLRPYIKQTTSSYYSMNFIYSNKIKRDCYTFLYFAMLIEILIGYFFIDRFANIGFISYISTACALLIVPIYGWVNYLLHPDKRIRAQFDFKITIAGALMLYVNLLVITILFGFFVFKCDIYSAESMIVPIFYPAVLLLNMPFSIIIYNILYRTKKYHLR